MNALLTWGDYVSNIRLDASKARFGSEALEDLLEHVPVAIAVTVGPGHRIVFANGTFRNALQKSHDDPRGKTMAEVRGKDYSAELAVIRQRVLETGEGAELPAHPVCSSGIGEVTYWDVKFLPVRDAKDRVVGILTLGLEVTSLVQAQEEAAQRLREAEYHHARLALAVEATALGLWEWDAQTGRTYWSPRQREIFGLPSGQEPTYEFWASALHPEDRDRVIQSVSKLMDPQSGGQLELEHRVVHPTDEVRWVLSRGRMTYEEVDGNLTPTRLLGTVLDITSRKHTEEERQLLLRETNHRVLNLFAMTSSMVGMTARSSRSPAEMAERLSGRIEALARAHELIRPALVSEHLTQAPTSLHDLIAIVLAPHNDIPGQRLSTSGPDVPVGSKAATALTLVFHELATNAAKYGALSVDAGRVEITWRLEGDQVQVHWCETGGPAVTAAPQRQGFGTRLLRGSLNQLAGEITYEWARSGLACTIRFARESAIR